MAGEQGAHGEMSVSSLDIRPLPPSIINYLHDNTQRKHSIEIIMNTNVQRIGSNKKNITRAPLSLCLGFLLFNAQLTS